MIFSQNKYIKIRDFSIFCMVGNLLYHLFPFPPIIWRLSFVVLCMLSLKEYVKTFRLSSFHFSILIFVFLNVLYFFSCFIWLEDPSTTFIGNVLYAMLSFLFFSFLGENGYITQKFITKILIIFSIAGVIYYYHAQQLALDRIMYDVDDTTVNAGAIFLMLIPMLFLLKKRVLSLFLLCLYIFFLLQAAKRGNILAATIPTILFVGLLIAESRKHFFEMLLIVVLVIIAANYIIDIVYHDDYLIKRFAQTLDGNSSGRDIIYTNAWNLWYGSNNIINYLFGFGYQGAVSNIGKMAHSDWLEILVDYGLLGCVSYLSIFISLINLISKANSIRVRLAVFSVFFIWILKSFYSMGFCDELLAILAIPLGISFSRKNIYEKNTSNY